MPYKKSFLPVKQCKSCHRPFTWRKKWEKVWDQVMYCSDRCRKQRGAKSTNNGTA
ncbi:MAG: DUF2256 domain-containing protein [Bacteroidota bacterium]